MNLSDTVQDNAFSSPQSKSSALPLSPSALQSNDNQFVNVQSLKQQNSFDPQIMQSQLTPPLLSHGLHPHASNMQQSLESLANQSSLNRQSLSDQYGSQISLNSSSRGMGTASQQHSHFSPLNNACSSTFEISNPGMLPLHSPLDKSSLQNTRFNLSSSNSSCATVNSLNAQLTSMSINPAAERIAIGGLVTGSSSQVVSPTSASGSINNSSGNLPNDFYNPAYSNKFNPNGNNFQAFSQNSTQQTQAPVKGEPEACLFVASLNAQKTDEQLTASVTSHFAHWGPLLNVKVMKDWMNRPYAFVQFSTVENARRALDESHDTIVDGRHIRVEQARVNRTLFIARLPKTMTEGALQAYFEKWGRVESVTMLVNSVTGRSKGCAFAKFRYREDAIRAYLHIRQLGKWAIEWASNIDKSQGDRDRHTIFVNMLNSATVTQELLEARFSAHGPIEDIKLINKEGDAFAFIRYEEEFSAQLAVEKENGTKFLDTWIQVQIREAQSTLRPVKSAQQGYFSSNLPGSSTVYSQPASSYSFEDHSLRNQSFSHAFGSGSKEYDIAFGYDSGFYSRGMGVEATIGSSLTSDYGIESRRYDCPSGSSIGYGASSMINSRNSTSRGYPQSSNYSQSLGYIRSNTWNPIGQPASGIPMSDGLASSRESLFTPRVSMSAHEVAKRREAGIVSALHGANPYDISRVQSGSLGSDVSFERFREMPIRVNVKRQGEMKSNDINLVTRPVELRGTLAARISAQEVQHEVKNGQGIEEYQSRRKEPLFSYYARDRFVEKTRPTLDKEFKSPVDFEKRMSEEEKTATMRDGGMFKKENLVSDSAAATPTSGKLYSSPITIIK